MEQYSSTINVWNLHFTARTLFRGLCPAQWFFNRAQLLTESYSNKSTVLLCWSRCHEKSTVVITNWLTVTKYPFLKWQLIFSDIYKIFLSSITDKTFSLKGNMNWLSFAVDTGFFCAAHVSNLFRFLCFVHFCFVRVLHAKCCLCLWIVNSGLS